jgi:hypothetical protein
MLSCSPRFEFDNLGSLQWTAFDWMGYHLAWLFSAVLRGATEEDKNRRVSVLPITIKKEKFQQELWLQFEDSLAIRVFTCLSTLIEISMEN